MWTKIVEVGVLPNGLSRWMARQMESVISGSVLAVRKASRYLGTLSGNFCHSLDGVIECESYSSMSLLQPLGVLNFQAFRLLYYHS